MSLRQIGFAVSVLFAALAALAFTPSVRLASRWIDSTTAAALYLTLVTALYAGMLGTNRSLRLASVLLVAGLGLMSALSADSLLPTLAALTLALAVSRARILCRGRFEHPWWVEAGIAALALIAVEVVVSPHSFQGIALSLWVYWLVQSAFFLVPTRSDSAETGGRDPFDVAVERATDLMDNAP